MTTDLLKHHFALMLFRKSTLNGGFISSMLMCVDEKVKSVAKVVYSIR